MPESFRANSEASWEAMVKWLRGYYDKHGWITVAQPRIGKDRSLDQNSFLHVALTEYAAHLLRKDKKQVTKGELAGMKRHAKGQFSAQHPDCQNWMIHVVTNPATGQTKKDYTSSKDWKRVEMTFFLDWLIATAAGDGLIIEARGDYAKYKEEAK